MEITEVRIKLMEDGGERLHAFCSITFDDCFVVRDLKIIEGSNGPFVAMPSRKLTSHCPQCSCKNHLRAGYCNQCGLRLNEDRAVKDEDGRAKLYADIAHPINSRCREMIQDRVIQTYHDELRRSKLPGYVSRYDDIDEDLYAPAADDNRHTRYDAPRKSEPQPATPHVYDPPRSKQPDREQRGPHKAPMQQRPAPRPNSGEKPGEFGAGIL